MKFSFNQASMAKSLQRIMGAVPTRMPMQSLGNIHFKLKDQALEMTATDLEITVTTKVEVIESEGDGSILIQAKRFNDIIRELPEVILEIDVQEPFKVTLKGEGMGVYTLPGGDPMDFPELPPIDSQLSFSLSGDCLKRVISKTSFAVSHDEMRPILTGVLMQIRPDELRVVATDGHRLSRIVKRGIDYTGESRDIVIPMKAFSLLMRNLEDADNPIIGIAETRASFKTDDLRLTTRLIEGHYPKYENVIPENNPNKLTINTDDMISTIKRVSIFANQISHQVKLTVAADSVLLETEDPDLGGRGEEKILANFEGAPLEIAYNSNYLMDVLKQVETDEFVFALNTSNDAAVFQGTTVDGAEDFLILLMPIRLK
ncbi:MAG: DNA polymerase III subunit beta [Candidatus Hatepunaea meridiana]|nr:DNA polymerase III subunit beta [Candidatus Hatepunaea meridiana]